jgi:hypothetical protein
LKNLNEELIKNKKDQEDTENYLTKYYPFKTLNYIHDALKAVLPGKPFMKLLNQMSHIYQYLDYQVNCDDGKGRLNKREFQMPEIEKEIEEYKERTDDFMTGFGDGSFFPRTSADRQRKLSNASHGEENGTPKSRDQ